MEKTKNRIIFIIILLNIYVYESALSNYFSSEYLSKEEIINTVNNNINLLNEAVNEIKSIDNSPSYIDAANWMARRRCKF